MDLELTRKLRHASQLHGQGRLLEAERLYREVLAVAPSDTNALHFLGLIESQLGNREAGLALIERAIEAAPGNTGALYNRAIILGEIGRLDEALAGYGKVLALLPGDPAVLNNRGAILAALKRYDEALADYESALARDPRNAGLLNNRGNALLALERYGDALQSYDAALSANPRHADALFGRANALRSLNRIDEALADYERSLALDSTRAEAHANRAQLLLSRKRHAEALAAYDAALALNPGLASAHERRAGILFELKRGEEALSAYDSAFAIDPDLPYLEGARFLTKMYLCDWSNVATERARLIDHVREGKPAANPFAFLSAGLSPADELLCARVYAQRQYPPREPMWCGERYNHRKTRLGYVSGEFREQATAYLAAGLFECHDRDAFELHAFSTGRDDKSPMRARIGAAFDSFSDMAGADDRDIAAAIRRAEIDILVNLNGFFGEERTGVAAFRPAPLQVNYLGYPGTMGAPYMDYIVADRIVIPDDQRAFYSESVIWLPDCYQANDRKKPRQRSPRPRSAFGLPESGFVFASFNNAYKITPEVFDIWMHLLRAVEGSVLWQLQLDAAASRNLCAEAAKRGVDPKRIVFAPFVKQDEHLARIGHADLFLDTLPVNAHTTASDALWCGVPVLTAMGATFAGRVAASLLAVIGLDELIAPSLAEYERLALSMARDPGQLRSLKEKLAKNRDTHPLFDTARLARHIETAYRKIHERQAKGLPPEGFAVSGE
jgi:predicted O-linked N-acetylglucosamine transferase (SPINDLY family)